ncbi:MAG: ABC transporter permease [Lachnospiraceae bacterium]|nr:ABC transporter permease [Lachnospiraceae bacterium]
MLLKNKILRKIFACLLTLLAASFAVFAAFEIIPGDAAVSRLGSNASESAVAALRVEMGLDKPFLLRYFLWLGGLFRLDLGTSYSYGIPVSEMLLDKLPITLCLTLMSMAVTVAVSVPLSIFYAKYARSRIDRTGYVGNQLLMAVPSFFLGIIMTWVFGSILRWFTPGGYVSYKKSFGGFLSYLILPSLAIAIPKCAMSVKLLRSAILTEADKEYVRTAYSRGLSTMEVLYRHVLKNAMIPLVTFWSMAVADMVAGSIVIEQVFNIPGLGRILLTSIANRDYPVVEAVIMLIAAVVVIMNYAADLICRRIDPRIRER